MNFSYANHPSNPAPCRLRLMFFLAALASNLAAANNHLVHNLLSDLPGVADQMNEQLVNPWDFSSLTFACR